MLIKTTEKIKSVKAEVSIPNRVADKFDLKNTYCTNDYDSKSRKVYAIEKWIDEEGEEYELEYRGKVKVEGSIIPVFGFGDLEYWTA